MDRFIKHSDAQVILSRLGLPMIDRTVAGRGVRSVQVIADDSDDDARHEHGPAVAAIADTDNAVEAAAAVVHAVDADDGDESMPPPANPAEALGEQLVEVSGLGGHASASNLQLVRRRVWGPSRMPTRELCKLREADYRSMTHGRAANIAEQASKALERVSQQLVLVRNAKRKLSRDLQIAHAPKKQNTLCDTSSSTLELTMTKSGKRLTASATLSLGLRRNLSHIAAGDFGALLLRDISAATVLRAEVKTGAAIAASMRHTVQDMMAVAPPAVSNVSLDDDLSDVSFRHDAWKLLFISLRADATNSSIWRREKLRVTEVEMGLVTSSVQSFPAQADQFMMTRRCLRLPQPTCCESA